MSSKKTNNTIQASWVALGSLFAFGFSLVSTIILSRYFEKADYGTYRQVLFVYHALLTVFTLGLPKAYAYFLPRVDDCYAKSLIKKITRIFYLLGGLFSISLFVFSPQIASVLNNPDLELALRVFSPVPFLLLPTMGIEGVFATYQKNKYMALYNIITKSLILLCVALPVVCWNGTYIHALIGFTIASFISFLLANYLKYWCVKSKGNLVTSISNKEILNFAMPLLFASMWGILTQSADKFFISRFFGSSVFAEFSNGSLELPFVGMIIGACSTVLMPLFSKKVYNGGDPRIEILPIWKSVFEKTIKIIYPLVLFIIFYADVVMIILYGTSFANSGLFFGIKLVVNFFTVISYFPILVAIGASKFYSKVQMFGAITVIVLEYLSILIFDSPYVVTAISVLCTIGRITVMLIFISHYFKVSLWKIIPVKLSAMIFFPSIIFLLCIRCVFSKYVGALNLIVFIIISFVLYFATYLIWSKIAKIDYISIILSLKLKK